MINTTLPEIDEIDRDLLEAEDYSPITKIQQDYYQKHQEL